MANITPERQAFEDWIKTQRVVIVWLGKHYSNVQVETAWRAWQAANKAANGPATKANSYVKKA